MNQIKSVISLNAMEWLKITFDLRIKIYNWMKSDAFGWHSMEYDV